MPTQTLKDRFLSYVKCAKNGCWLWLGATDGAKKDKPAAKFFVRGKLRKAARVSWELFRGDIPVGCCVLHDCPTGDDPMCVNPDHLWLGTQLENVADRVAKDRSSKGESHGRAHLTEDKVKKIKKELAEARTIQPRREYGLHVRLARRYRCTVDMVRDIDRGRTWKHVIV